MFFIFSLMNRRLLGFAYIIGWSAAQWPYFTSYAVCSVEQSILSLMKLESFLGFAIHFRVDFILVC